MTQDWKQWEGQTLDGKFYLREYLGGSEHSAVFLTGDQDRGVEKAAIKLIPADTANADHQLSRWKEAAKLSHPHLIRLFQTGRCRLGDRDLLYVVMEYAKLDLSQVLSQAPFPPEETRETLRVILDTLAYLHGKGFVHGHLKPANIMSVDGQLKLSSDGLCRRGESGGGRGTPGDYDPPEAESGMKSPAGDVWSLGMLLAELMSQHPSAWVTTEEGDPVLSRTIPAPFFDIARNCLRGDPERRWTVAEIAARLETPAPASKPQKAASKRRYIVAAAAAALTLAVVLAGLKLLNRHQRRAGPGPKPGGAFNGAAHPEARRQTARLPCRPPATALPSIRSGGEDIRGQCCPGRGPAESFARCAPECAGHHPGHVESRRESRGGPVRQRGGCDPRLSRTEQSTLPGWLSKPRESGNSSLRRWMAGPYRRNGFCNFILRTPPLRPFRCRPLLRGHP